MALRRSMTLFVTIVILIIIALLVEHHDAALIGEIKIMLTIMFGLATSILLFVFIWLVQRESLNGLSNGLNMGLVDAPSMHPRGRSGSLQSVADDPNRTVICSISHQLDKPPNYEEALISPKPIYWENSSIRKEGESAMSHWGINMTGPMACPLHSRGVRSPDANNSVGRRDSCTCSEEFTMDPTKSVRKTSTGIQVARIARSLIRGFTGHEVASSHNSANSHALTEQQMTNSTTSDGSNRKLSYQQLDAGQLSVSCSPPKYGDLVLNGQMDSITTEELERMC